jgi:hypothetical protein
MNMPTTLAKERTDLAAPSVDAPDGAPRAMTVAGKCTSNDYVDVKSAAVRRRWLGGQRKHDLCYPPGEAASREHEHHGIAVGIFTVAVKREGDSNA